MSRRIRLPSPLQPVRGPFDWWKFLGLCIGAASRHRRLRSAHLLGVLVMGFDPKTDSDEFSEGIAAFRDARGLDANPHPMQTTEREIWILGWEYALDMREKTRADKGD